MEFSCQSYDKVLLLVVQAAYRFDVCSSGKTIHCRIALSINEILAEAGNPLISVPALFYRFYHLIIINIQFKNFVTGLGFAYCALGLQQD
jgi:hypothetical protein